jgi:hypothetical protein
MVTSPDPERSSPRITASTHSALTCPSLSGVPVIVRNFHILKWRPSRPTRGWLNNTGPPVEAFVASAIATMSGAMAVKRHAAMTRSRPYLRENATLLDRGEATEISGSPPRRATVARSL